MKYCYKCKLDKLKIDFYKSKANNDGLQYACKSCQSLMRKDNQKLHKIERLEYCRKWYEKNKEHVLNKKRKYQKENSGKVNALVMKRYTAKLLRIPVYANLEAIKQIYINCPKGYEVDHIIPLQGKLVSGFHHENNLQYLTKSQNCKKNNKLTINKEN